jgi:hypothetical protein
MRADFTLLLLRGRQNHQYKTEPLYLRKVFRIPGIRKGFPRKNTSRNRLMQLFEPNLLLLIEKTKVVKLAWFLHFILYTLGILVKIGLLT